MPIQLDALEQAKSTLIDLAIKFGPKVLVAILIAIAGFYAATWVGKVVNRSLLKFDLEPPAGAFHDFEARLRGRRFAEDQEDGVICRWRHRIGLTALPARHQAGVALPGRLHRFARPAR